MSDVVFRRRREIKYLLSPDQLDEFHRQVGGILTADRHGGESGGYYNHSIYFDSLSGRYGREKTEGLSLRTKPRIRFYRRLGDFEPLAVFLELKQRYDDFVLKERTVTDFDTANALLSPFRSGGVADDGGSAVLAKFHYLRQRHDLRPMVAVLYRRQAFGCDLFPGLRITFDRTVSATDRTDAATPPEFFHPVLPSNRIVLEIKYNYRMPDWIAETIHRLEMRQVSISKYVTGLRSVHGAYFAHQD